MVLSVFIIFIVLFVYLKYPQVFEFNSKYSTGRYIRLERTSGSDPINYANFIIYDDKASLLLPTSLNVYPGLTAGLNGINPKSLGVDTSDIVLVETSGAGTPYVEYDLGSVKNISNIVIINRKKTASRYNERMSGTTLKILNNDRVTIFTKQINEVQETYSIKIS